MNIKKLLIIKTGRHETFNPELWNNTSVSLGDVLRTTVLLNFYQGYKIDWVTSKEAFDLISNVHLIHKIYLENDFNLSEISHYDLIINLESSFIKTPHYQKLIGLNEKDQIINSQGAHFTITHLDHFNLKTWNDKLSWLIGHDCKNAKLFITPPTSHPNEYQVGLNWKVGPKIKEKIIEKKYWDHFHDKLKSDFSISWQQGEKNIHEYINWINKCEIVITCDSLGLHIAKALNKKVFALFTATSIEEFEVNTQHHFYYFDCENLNRSKFTATLNLENFYTQFIKSTSKT